MQRKLVSSGQKLADNQKACGKGQVVAQDQGLSSGVKVNQTAFWLRQ